MNAPILTEHRECSSCHQSKPLTDAFFELRDNGVELVFRRQCRDCRRRAIKSADKALAPERRRCSSCYLKLGLKAFNGDSLKCKLCEGMNGCNSARRRHRAPPGTEHYVPGPKPCRLCCSQSWRVDGIRCAEPSCQLQWAPEPRPELRLRRFDRVG